MSESAPKPPSKSLRILRRVVAIFSILLLFFFGFLIWAFLDMAEAKREWVGRDVFFRGQEYRVIDAWFGHGDDGLTIQQGHFKLRVRASQVTLK